MTNSYSSRVAGSRFGEKAIGFAWPFLIKHALREGLVISLQQERMLLRWEVAERGADGRAVIPDFALCEHSNSGVRTHAIGEIKWSGSLRGAKNQISNAVKANAAACFESHAAVSIIVLGYPLQAASDLEALRKHVLKQLNGQRTSGDSTLRESQQVALKEGGILAGSILEFSDESGAVARHPRKWIFVLSHTERLNECLAAWLTGETENPTYGLADRFLGLMIDLNAKRVRDAAISQGQQLPLLELAFPETRVDVSALLAFFENPLSKVTHDYVNLGHCNALDRSRWSALLNRALEDLSGGAFSELHRLLERAVPPMPMNLGIRRHKVVVPVYHFFTNARGPSAALRKGPPVCLVEGPSGAGKTTLLEQLYGAWIEALAFGEDLLDVRELPILLPVQRLNEEMLKSLGQESSAYNALDILCAAIIAPSRQGSFEQVTGISSRNMLVGRGADHLPIVTATGQKLLSALFRRIPVCLLIDGYDQLREKHRSEFARFGPALKEAGLSIRRVVISSRPGANVRIAWDWAASLADDLDAPGSNQPLICEYVVSAPDESASSRYITAWLNIANVGRAGRSVGDGRSDLTLGGFIKWLEGPENKRRTTQEIVMANVLQSPLLTTLALIAFLTSSAQGDHRIETTSDLFEPLLFDLTRWIYEQRVWLDKSAKPPPQNIAAGRALRRFLEDASFGVLMRTDRIQGQLASNDVLHYLRDGTTVERLFDESFPLKAHNLLEVLRGLPFIEANQMDGYSSFEFLHPSFQEYLAAGCLARMMSSERELVCPREDGVLVQALSTAGETRTTLLGEVIVKLGRDAFKYLLCHLRRFSSRERFPSTLTRLLDACGRDFGLQQYLYDAGYIDVAIEELRVARTEIESRVAVGGGVVQLEAIAVLEKSLGHYDYGQSDYQAENKSFEKLLDYAERLALDPDRATLGRWYQLFAYDHLHNRSGNSRWQERFEEQLPSSLRSRSKREAPMDTGDVPFVLRAAHYWGHLGNRALAAAEALDVAHKTGRNEARTLVRQGEQHYAMAIDLRLVSLWLSMPEWFSKHKSYFGAPSAYFRSWRRFIQSSSQSSRCEFERFVGPSQAVGDIANQHCGLATLHLWSWLMHRATGDRVEAANAIERAQEERSKSEALWELSSRPAVRKIRGEGPIKYRLYTAGLSAKIELAKRIHTGERPTLSAARATSTELLEMKRRDLEEELGLRYEVAESRLPDSVNRFVSMVAEVEELPS